MKLFILLALVHVGLLASLRDLGAGADVTDGSGMVVVIVIVILLGTFKGGIQKTGFAAALSFDCSGT